MQITIKGTNRPNKKETNRIIGFLKTQDKNLVQTEQNIYSFFEERTQIKDKKKVIEVLVNGSKPFLEKSAKEYFENDENRVNDFMNMYEDISVLFYEYLEKAIKEIK